MRLAILFAAALVVLLLVRQRFVPESFGRVGHYRADVVEVIANQPVRYAGLEACADCHTDESELKQSSYHRGLTCEGCHGPAQDHVDDPVEHQPQVTRDGELCLQCHVYLSSRPTGFPQVIERAHNPVDACVDCHDPHDPTPPEVPGACSACHAQIASTKSVSHHRSIDCEVCHESPAEHRVEPRAHRPDKPATREFCGGCHAPDAESERRVPRVDVATHGGRYLCWQCHYPHHPEGR